MVDTPQQLAREHIRAAQARLTPLGAAVRPIYSVSDSGEPEAHGSCVLVAIGKRQFCFTAAHVFDHHDHSLLYIAGAEDLIELPRTWYGSELPESRRRADDRVDMAYCELPDHVVAQLGASHWVPSATVEHPPQLDAHPLYFTVGYPTRYSRLNRGESRIAHKGQIYAGVELDASSYAGRGLDRRIHLAIQFHRKKVVTRDAARVATVKPYGKSGGGVWRFDSLLIPELDVWANPLVGILTEWDQDHGLMIATRAALHLEYVLRTFPELRR